MPTSVHLALTAITRNVNASGRFGMRILSELFNVAVSSKADDESAGFEVDRHVSARMGVMGASLTRAVQACLGWTPCGHRVAGDSNDYREFDLFRVG